MESRAFQASNKALGINVPLNISGFGTPINRQAIYGPPADVFVPFSLAPAPILRNLDLLMYEVGFALHHRPGKPGQLVG